MPEDLISKLPARLFGYPHTRRQSGCVARDVAGKVQEQAGKLVGSKEQAVVDPKQTYGPGLPTETMSMGRSAVKAPSRLTLFHSPAGGLMPSGIGNAEPGSCAPVHRRRRRSGP
jgi:hypothetical protein